MSSLSNVETVAAAAPGDRSAVPFSVAGHLPGGRLLNAVVAPIVDRALGLAALQRMYARAGTAAPGRFAAHALGCLGIELRAEGATGRVPASGGLLVVANHPFGGLDGLALLETLQQIRADVKVLGNQWLAAIPELRQHLVAVDSFGTKSGRTSNAWSLRAAHEWLAGGGCLLTFPAGEVAHRVTESGVALDGAWHPHVSALAVKSRADVLPVFVAGTNRLRFRAAGRLHPWARTALLPRELLARRGSQVRLVIGEPISAASLSRLPAGDRAPYLKTRTYLLAASITTEREPIAPPAVIPTPTAPPADPACLARDVEQLSAERLLTVSGGLQVYCAGAGELPHVLPEIGRLREVTFRSAGEGTGRARDLDGFDRTYWHLFAWDPAKRRIAGAYRLGVTDEILPVYGAGGLYTATLFHYDDRLLREIGPAIELGRSFVAEDYQRAFGSLLALWRGIGAFVARRPACRHVFGAVSISNRYDTLSRQLLVRFLTAVASHPAAASLVRPRRPLPTTLHAAPWLETATVQSLEGVSSLLGAIEPDGKTVPVLVRQYLNLNARLLGFSVDPQFGDALDGLMLADLTDVPRAMLERLMGAGQAQAFLRRHRAPAASNEPERTPRLAAGPCAIPDRASA